MVAALSWGVVALLMQQRADDAAQPVLTFNDRGCDSGFLEVIGRRQTRNTAANDEDSSRHSYGLNSRTRVTARCAFWRINSYDASGVIVRAE